MNGFALRVSHGFEGVARVANFRYTFFMRGIHGLSFDTTVHCGSYVIWETFEVLVGEIVGNFVGGGSDIAKGGKNPRMK